MTIFVFKVEELDSYLDTIIAGVGQIFRHHSVGARISVGVVRKVYMDG